MKLLTRTLIRSFVYVWFIKWSGKFIRYYKVDEKWQCYRDFSFSVLRLLHSYFDGIFPFFSIELYSLAIRRNVILAWQMETIFNGKHFLNKVLFLSKHSNSLHNNLCMNFNVILENDEIRFKLSSATFPVSTVVYICNCGLIKWKSQRENFKQISILAQSANWH